MPTGLPGESGQSFSVYVPSLIQGCGLTAVFLNVEKLISIVFAFCDNILCDSRHLSNCLECMSTEYPQHLFIVHVAFRLGWKSCRVF